MTKILIIIYVISMLSWSALAAPTKKINPNKNQQAEQDNLQRTPAQEPTEPKHKPIAQKLPDLKGLSVFGHYDLVDTIDFDGTSNNNVSVSGNFQVGSTFGLGAQYDLTQLESGIFIIVGGTYEFSRTFSKTSYSAGNQRTTENFTNPKPEINFWTVFGNANIQLTPKIAAFAGLNYNFVNTKNITGTSKGKLGYQLGGSYLYSDVISFEIIYRTLNFSTSSDTISIDNAKLQGFLFRLCYGFI